MILSDSGIKRLEKYEGKSLKVYNDEAGKPTIGVGHLIKNGESFTEITEEECQKLLLQDVSFAVLAVKSLVRVPLSQDQIDSLISFVFNMGVEAFHGSSLLKAINSGARAEVIRSEFMKWNKVRVNGSLVASKGLTKRREDESSYWKG